MCEVNQFIPVSELHRYPIPDITEVTMLLEKEIAEYSGKIVVLDDDPTGVQTVHDVSVYTSWHPEQVDAGFTEDDRLFFILTNSRSMSAEKTTAVHHEIAKNILATAHRHHSPFLLISRSDSTLRGHYPLETEVLRNDLLAHGNITIDAEILCPFFKEGGRFTIDDIHYVQNDEMLIPAALTEFAKDPTFGYSSSNLRGYIEEKTNGRFKASDVISISLDDLRNLNISRIEQILLDARDFQKVIVNAADEIDVKVFCIALYRALKKGKYFLFRSAASLVKCIGGFSDRPLLCKSEMIHHETNHGGIVIAGSYTQKTTRQLHKLLEEPDTVGIEFRSDLVMDGGNALHNEAKRVAALCSDLIEKGQTPVCYTNRRLLTMESDDSESALRRSARISEGVQAIVSNLSAAPAFVIAKGGITSSDVGTKALNVTRARVSGQIQPGVPVWETGPESRFPGIPFVIFPGNVGNDDSLQKAAAVLMA